MPRLPKKLLPGITWEDVLVAIDHDEGLHMRKPFPRGVDRSRGSGIFVLDGFGRLYCGTKLRGTFHHTSFVRGHVVKVAGGLEVVNGKLVELTPHSGHYRPSEEDVDAMIKAWRAQGVDFAQVRIKGYVKM